MAEISKQALKVANNTEFPNNNAGAITPSRLRGFNTDMIDSLVDEISYTADSASWEQSIAALEAFTGSATGLTTGSLLITASANLNTITFTKGNGSTFNVTVNTGSVVVSDLGPLNAFTASIAGTNAFTASTAISINSLNVFTQSIQSEVNGLEAKTGSYATTGSNTFIGNQTIVGNISASSFVSASNFIGNGSQITGITASVATTILDDGILQGTATSLNFTGSGITATVVAGVAIIEASIDQSTLGRYTLTSSFNSYTQSADAKINSLNGFTASVAGTNTFTASIAGTNNFTASIAGTNAFTQSTNTSIATINNSLTAINSYTASNSTYEINQWTGSINAFTASIKNTNTFTASAQLEINALEAFSASVLGTNTFTASIAGTNAFTASIAGTNTFTASIAGTNAFTQSANARLNSIEAQSGSWVTSAVTASSLVTASVNVNVITFTKGNGTTFNLTVDASGSVSPGTVSGSAQIAALGFISSSVTSSMAVSSSEYAVTASLARNVIISAVNANQSTLPIGRVVRITGATGDNPQFNTASWDNDSTSANTLGILANTSVSGDYADIIVIGKVVGVNTDPALGYAAGDVLYLSSSGQFTNVQPQAPLHIVTLGEVLRVQQNNGSIFVNVSNGWELNELHNVRITNPLQGDVLVYEASSSLWKNVPSSSITPTDISALNAFTASVAGTNAFTQSIQAEVDDIQAKTGSFVTTSSFNAYTASVTESVVTAIVTNNGSNYYIVDGVNQPKLSFVPGPTYRFDLSGIVGSHPFKFSTTANGPTEYTTGVTSGSNFIQIQVGYDTTTPLYYYCTNHNGMGNEINVLGIEKLVTTASFNAYTASQSTINTGSFATTGSNVFTGDQLISGSLEVGTTSPIFKVNTTSSFYGRGVWIIADGYTSSLAYITASVSGSNSNLIFKNGSTTTATVVSGSSNIFQSPAAPTAGFIRHIGGSHNLMLTSGSVPQISGSMLTAPSFMGNVLSNVSANQITLRGPVSASAYSITQNILMGGQINYGASAANSFDKATAGMSTQGNALFNGTINVNAPTTPLSSSVSISGNLLFGASITLNCFSSSITYASNVQNGGITVNNSYVAASGSSAAVLNLRSNINTIYGIGHALNVSGTNTSTTQGKQFFANLLAGTFLSSSMGTGDNCNILATGVIGNSLIITGSTLTSTFAGADSPNSGQGSLFAGRFNDISGTKNLTGETVFAIGTGTSNTNRKTGLLIDSGSNTFVEGSLNVSGSSSFTGSMNFLSGSASGSVVTNIGDTFTGTEAVTKIISLSSAEYAALSPKDPNTLYIIV